MEIHLTTQEVNVKNYLIGKNHVDWSELKQFTTDPVNVKETTLRRIVSEIKWKYKQANQPFPFTCSIGKKDAIKESIEFLKPVTIEIKPEPKPALVELRRTVGGNMVPVTNQEPDAKIDFVLETGFRRVRTKKYGAINLSPTQWELFSYFMDNVGKNLCLYDMKDVVYKHFGSKTPANWSDAIRRTINQLRTNIPELKTDNRLMTIVSNNQTFYMLK